MNLDQLLDLSSPLWSPGVFAGLVVLAVGCVWMALRPSAPLQQVRERMGGYLEGDPVQEEEMERSFSSRVVVPAFRRVLRLFGRLAPKRNIEGTRMMLLHAGEPGQLSVLDFFGLRLLCGALLGAAVFVALARQQAIGQALQLALVLGALGFFAPVLWLRNKAKSRKHDIARALPDALDMLTIGVEAGLAFESALLRVGEKWDNALTHELRRAVAEMRVGVPRDEALQRVVERSDVEDLRTFVAVLVQSTQLGVSIAEVLHSQAAGMRVKRRQRAEELARQAGVKMVFPLVFLILPAMFVVILGPAVPRLAGFFGAL